MADTTDERIYAFEKENHKLSTAMIYKASVRGEHKLPSFAFIWHNFAPPRVRFFAWLLVQNRIQCKVNLAKKGAVTNTICDICKTQDEGADHIISTCTFARQF